MVNSVFVSYSSKDGPFVRALVSDLEKVGLDVWFDETRLVGGDPLVERLSQAIGEATVILVVLSPHSTQSRWVLKEIELAVTKEVQSDGFRVIPVVLGSAEIPLLLSGKVPVNVDWPRGYQAGLDRIFRALGIAAGARKPRDFGVSFLQRVQAALQELARCDACYVAPLSAEVAAMARQTCQIPADEEIYALVASSKDSYTVRFVRWIFGAGRGIRPKPALVFTETGVYGAGITKLKPLGPDVGPEFYLTYQNLRGAEISEFEQTVELHSHEGMREYCTYYLVIGGFALGLPSKTRPRVKEVLRQIQSF